MDFVFTALVTVFIGAGLLVALIALIIHPRVDQLISGDWLPEGDAATERFDRSL